MALMVWGLRRLPTENRCRIIQAVDNGEPLLPVLTQELHIVPWMLRHFVKHEKAFFKAFKGDAVQALAAIRWATPELAPTKVTPLARLSRLSNVLESPINWSAGDNRQAFCRLIDNEADVLRIENFLIFVRHLTEWVEDSGCGTPNAIVGQRLGLTVESLVRGVGLGGIEPPTSALSGPPRWTPPTGYGCPWPEMSTNRTEPDGLTCHGIAANAR